MIHRQYIKPKYLFADIIDISAPIIPSLGMMGNLKLDTNINDIRDWVFSAYDSTFPFRKLLQAKLLMGLQVDYIYRNGILTFSVDICTGNINMITCKQGYLGKFDENIYMGNTWYNIPNRLEIFDTYNGYSLKSSLPELQGLSILVPEHLADGYDDLGELPDFVIEEIGIFSRYVDGMDLYSRFYTKPPSESDMI